MESLLQQLEGFAGVVAASRTRHAGGWGRVTVRRALRWGGYLRHVHGRFRRRGPVRAALEERLRGWRPQRRPGGEEAGSGAAPGPPLRSFAGLAHGDELLALGLLENAALPGPALHELLRHLRPAAEEAEEAGLPERVAGLARRRAASQLLLRLPGAAEAALRSTEAQLLRRRLRGEPEAQPLLDRLWAQLPRPRCAGLLAAALLPPPAEDEEDDEEEEEPGPGPGPLLAWLLARPAPRAALCSLLPAPLLAALAQRHPALARAWLAELTRCGRSLRFDPVRAAWLRTSPEGLCWAGLRDRFRCLCQAPAPLGDQARAALDTCKAQDGGFEAPGLSVWSDLARAIEPGERGEDAPRGRPQRPRWPAGPKPEPNPGALCSFPTGLLMDL